MKKITLMGPRKFVDMPVGTLYIQCWKNNREECDETIKAFLSNPLELLDFSDMEVYGSNSGSMAFIRDDDDPDDYMFYYDANVVGDADPSHTLYIVFDESFIPEFINCHGHNYDELFPLSREKILEIRNEFINLFKNMDNSTNPENDWARETLDTDYSSTDEDRDFVNLYIEYTIE